MTRWALIRWALPALVTATLLAGCSQVAQLAPVASFVTSVRAAGVDVLLDKGVAIGTAPVCTVSEKGTEIDCAGTTTDGTPITVHNGPAAPADMTVTVGTTVVYTGPVEDVLDAHARPAS